jgi:hypothetical protein
MTACGSDFAQVLKRTVPQRKKSLQGHALDSPVAMFGLALKVTKEDRTGMKGRSFLYLESSSKDPTWANRVAIAVFSNRTLRIDFQLAYLRATRSHKQFLSSAVGARRKA